MTAQIINFFDYGPKYKKDHELDRLVDDVMREYPQTLKHLHYHEVQLPSDSEPSNEPA